jgi:molecular chaperone DnaK (HSP70)
MSACSFNKGKLSVLSYSSCPVGGRAFDEAIARFFCEEFRAKYKLDVLANKKALLKLLVEAEKVIAAALWNQNRTNRNVLKSRNRNRN